MKAVFHIGCRIQVFLYLNLSTPDLRCKEMKDDMDAGTLDSSSGFFFSKCITGASLFLDDLFVRLENAHEHMNVEFIRSRNFDIA